MPTRLIARAKQGQVARILTFRQQAGQRCAAVSYDESGDGMRVKAEFWAAPVEFRIGAPGAHIAAQCAGRAARVAAADGDVLNAAAALKDFPRSRAAARASRAGGVEVIDESYNANPASMAAALALLGNAPGPPHRRAGRHAGDGPDAAAHHAGACRPRSTPRTSIWSLLCGPLMKALWERLPAARRAAYAPTSAELAPALSRRSRRRHGAGQRLQRQPHVRDHRRAEGAEGLSVHALLSFLPPHADQLAFFRLFRYLTFRSGGAVLTALLIAFFIGPALIRWLKLQAGQGPADPQRRPAAPHRREGGHADHGRPADPLPVVSATLLWADLSNPYVWVVLLVTVGYGLLGFPDDYLKVTKHTPRASAAALRLLVEFGVALRRDLADHAGRRRRPARHAGRAVLQDRC